MLRSGMSDFRVTPDDRIAAGEASTGEVSDHAPQARYRQKERGFLSRLGSLFVSVSGVGFNAAFVCVAMIFVGFWLYGHDLPGLAKLADYEPPIVSRVYAGNGRLIGEFASEKRVFMPYRLIPKKVSQAFIAAEDQRYFSHNGVDLIGTIRAGSTTARSFLSGGNRLVGGSTITQQVAKNFLLTKERKLKRKIKELILALRIESTLSKEQILELYLNEIFLGNRAYGVAAAAQVYFGKSLRELNIAEAAMLAGMPQAPSRYNPLRNPEAARARRDYVIGRMQTDGYITAEQATAALKAPLGIREEKKNLGIGAEYFLEEIRRELVAMYSEEKLKKGGYSVRSTLDPELQLYADQALRKGLVAYDRRHGYRGPLTKMPEKFGANWASGWKMKLARIKRPAGSSDWLLAVVLLVDQKEAIIGLADGTRGRIPLGEVTWARKQGEKTRKSGKKMFTVVGPRIRKVQDVLDEGDVILVEQASKPPLNKPYPDDTYTLRQIPVATAAIVAMDPHTGRVLAMSGGFSFRISQYNTVTQAQRQPGSSFKPIVYLTALENGFTPSTLVLDAPVVVRMSSGETYKPLNSSEKFYGPTTLRRGLELSRNVMTVRLAERVGREKVSEMAVRLGVSKNLPTTMAASLGAYETTVFKMATAYSILVNGGRKVRPTLIDRIQDRYGRTIFRHSAFNCSTCLSRSWQGQGMPKLPDTREQIISEESAFQVVAMMQGAVQRGTGRRVLAVGRPIAGKTGTTNDSVDAWFVGMSPDMVVATWVGFEKSYSLGYREEGSRTAVPIFRDFMKKALKGIKLEFRPPKGLVAIQVALDNDARREKDKRIIYEYFKVGVRPGSSPDGLEPGGGDSKFTGAVGNEY